MAMRREPDSPIQCAAPASIGHCWRNVSCPVRLRMGFAQTVPHFGGGRGWGSAIEWRHERKRLEEVVRRVADPFSSLRARLGNRTSQKVREITENIGFSLVFRFPAASRAGRPRSGISSASRPLFNVREAVFKFSMFPSLRAENR